MPPFTSGMSNAEFVECCYDALLRRKPSEAEKNRFVEELNSGILNREGVLLAFLTSEEFEARLAVGEAYPSGHFHSVVPSRRDREAFTFPNPRETKVLGIDLNEDEQLRLLRELSKFHDECPFPEREEPQFRYYFENPSYGHMDGLTLYSMLRHLRPKRVIEVGSGFTSGLMLDTNDAFLEGTVQFTFIEPHPELVLSLFREGDESHEIISRPLQEVDAERFATLEANDILFVDSSHVSKLNSDVNRLLFDILPRLRKGVFVHFHDIFWPFEYPETWVREGKSWNEAYVLRAFLEFNDSFRIVLFCSYLTCFHRGWFERLMPSALKGLGAGLWIQKT